MMVKRFFNVIMIMICLLGAWQSVFAQNVETYMRRALSSMERGDADSAIADCNRALQINRNSAVALFARCTAYGIKGNFGRAIEDCEAVLRIEPNHSGARQTIEELRRAGQQRLDGTVRNVARAASDAFVTYFERGNASMRRGLNRENETLRLRDIDSAIADYNRAIVILPTADVLINRGLAYTSKNDFARGIADLEEALRLEPNNAGARETLEAIRRQQARQQTPPRTQAPAQNQTNAEAYYERGVAFLMQNNLDSAIANFEVASRLVPNDTHKRNVLESARQVRQQQQAPARPQTPPPALPATTSTPSSVGTRGTFRDPRDGKTYRTVVMPDGKTWMAENLNFATSSGSWCYDNSSANCNTYGRLYDWNTAMTACPAGWRLPRDSDWDALIIAVGGSQTAGTKLKSSSTWQSDSRAPRGTDNFGFSALPGGNRWDGSFDNVGYSGRWWTAAESDATRAQGRNMDYFLEGVVSGWYNRSRGFSVRCVRN